MDTFYLGAHHADWLERANVPLFVSRRTLADRKTMPKASTNWALDSGGFTELKQYGRWTITPKQYVEECKRYIEIGNLDWIAPQDWMCEREQILSKTGLEVEDHQLRTVENYLELRSLAPELPIIPVIQGWTLGQYLDCIELYDKNGIDLKKEKLVGIGSICRRKAEIFILQVISWIAGDGIKLHAFGLQTQGILDCYKHIVSADTMAWSYDARMTKQKADLLCTHERCNNCIKYALQWRANLLERLEGYKSLASTDWDEYFHEKKHPGQLRLFK